MDHSITVNRYWDGKGMAPMIRLRGRWLAAAGFEEGKRLRVEVIAGVLLLIPEEVHKAWTKKLEGSG